jgi:ABC-2 type transport system permease protein
MSMSRIWTIATHEYVINVRRPGFIILTLLIPLLGLVGLLVAAFLGVQSGALLERQFTPQAQIIGIVDHYGGLTPIPAAYADQFRAFPDEAAGRAALADGAVDSLLFVPSDYLATGKVTIISKGSSFNTAIASDSSRLREFFVTQLTKGKLDPQLQARLVKPIDPVIVTEGQTEPGRGGDMGMVLNMLVPYFFGMLLVITIFTSSGYLLRSVADEKTSRVIEIVLSSVSAQELLSGKVLGLGAVGLTQVAVWLLSTVALSGGALGLLGVAIPLLARPDVFVLAVIYYLLGFLVYAVLMGAGGALGTTMQESQQIAGIFSMFAATPFFLAGFLFSNPNMALARVLSWFPLTSPTMMLLRVPMTNVPLIDIIGSIVMLLLSIPLILWAGAKVFRMGLLMYGKRASARQVWRTLREA